VELEKKRYLLKNSEKLFLYKKQTIKNSSTIVWAFNFINDENVKGCCDVILGNIVFPQIIYYFLQKALLQLHVFLVPSPQNALFIIGRRGCKRRKRFSTREHEIRSGSQNLFAGASFWRQYQSILAPKRLLMQGRLFSSLLSD